MEPPLWRPSRYPPAPAGACWGMLGPAGAIPCPPPTRPALLPPPAHLQPANPPPNACISAPDHLVWRTSLQIAAENRQSGTTNALSCFPPFQRSRGRLRAHHATASADSPSGLTRISRPQQPPQQQGPDVTRAQTWPGNLGWAFDKWMGELSSRAKKAHASFSEARRPAHDPRPPSRPRSGQTATANQILDLP